MTVSTQTYKNTYSGDGSDTTFDFSFPVLDETHILVQIKTSAGVITDKTITTHYTVSGTGNTSGATDYTSGTITFISAPSATETVIIKRNVPFTQSTDYVENDPFPAETHEDALDKLTMLEQQQQEELDRAIKIDSAVSGFTGTLPDPSTYADKYLKYNSAGSAVEAVALATAATNSQGISHTSSFTGSVARNVRDRLDDIPSAKDFGATGDGTTNDRDYINAADTAGDFIVPSGTYLIGSNLTISNNIIFLPGAVLKPDTGVTLTINGTISAGDYQIFDLSSSTSIAFGTQRESLITWFGAVADNGTTDNSTAIQSCIDAMGNGGDVVIPDRPINTYYGLDVGLTVNYHEVTIRGSRMVARLKSPTNDITLISQTGTKFGLQLINLALSCAASSGSAAVLSLNGSFLFKLERVYIDDAVGHGFTFQGICTEGLISYCRFENGVDTGSGFNIGSSCRLLTFIACESTAGLIGFNDAGDHSNKFIGCHAWDNAQHGFSIGSEGGSAVSCSSFNNSQNPVTTYSGISLTGEGASAIACHTYDDQGTATQLYGTRFNKVSQTTLGIYGTGNDTALISNAATLDIASAATIAVNLNAKYANITGTTNITSITATYAGHIVTLKFADILTFTDGSNLKLAGNFTTSADDMITLVCDGTNWYEMARSAN